MSKSQPDYRALVKAGTMSAIDAANALAAARRGEPAPRRPRVHPEARMEARAQLGRPSRKRTRPAVTATSASAPAPALISELSDAAETARAARLILQAAGLAEPQSLTRHAVLHGAPAGDCADCDLVRATDPHLFLPAPSDLAAWDKTIDALHNSRPAPATKGRKFAADLAAPREDLNVTMTRATARTGFRPARRTRKPEMTEAEAAALVLAAAGL